MHTLQSDPIVFIDSPECHETITGTYDASVKLLAENASEELFADIMDLLADVSDRYFIAKKAANKSFEPLFQVTIERPVKTFDQKGKVEIACFVGVYCADKNDIAADEAEGGTLAEVVHSFALVLDPETRRIMRVSGAEYQTHPATGNSVN